MNIDFENGMILPVDKPYEWTSFDVIRKMKYAIAHSSRIKKFKIGHAGTLDPLATGLLMVCIGKATKKISELQNGIKEYTGEFFLGATTPSYDMETEVNETFSTAHISPEKILSTAKTMTGLQMQTAPVYSAKSVDGKKLYELARKNKTADIKQHEIEILNFEILKINLPLVEFRITCSKGTYIRSIAHDFGKKLDSGAYLHSLRRTKSGDFSVENAKTLSQWIKEISGEDLDESSKRKFHRDGRK